jgi:hypothetical protein
MKIPVFWAHMGPEPRAQFWHFKVGLCKAWPCPGYAQVYLGHCTGSSFLLRLCFKSLITFCLFYQWPYEAAALAFEAIPRTLLQNCGLNVIRTMTQLQGKVIAYLSIDI